jgi:hypothetical protein
MPNTLRHGTKLSWPYFDFSILQLHNDNSLKAQKYLIGIRVDVPEIRLFHPAHADNMVIEPGQNHIPVPAGELRGPLHQIDQRCRFAHTHPRLVGCCLCGLGQWMIVAAGQPLDAGSEGYLYF